MEKRQPKSLLVLLVVLVVLLTSTVGVSYNFKLEESTKPKESLPTIDSGLMDSAWPMQCHDQRHTSLSPYSTEHLPPGAVKWKFKADGWIESGVTIDKNCNIYFGDNDRFLYKLDKNGNLLWNKKVNGWIVSTPAIAEDGTIYFGSWDDYLYALTHDGVLKWKFHALDTIVSSPVIAYDGTIYFGVMGPGSVGRIYAVNPNGSEKWHYDTGYWITSSPTIGEDETIYIGSGDNALYALYPNGSLKWKFPTGDYIKGPPSIATDGTIYVGSWDDYLYALYPNNGSVKWKYKLRYGTETNPSIAADGTIYVGSDKLYAVNPNGTAKWSLILENRTIHKSSPAISADGTIYVGVKIGEGSGGEILAVNSDGTVKWRKIIGEMNVQSSPCIGPDGTVYIGSSFLVEGDIYGYLYAFGLANLSADANGPYNGLTNRTIQFSGDVYGGYPPYTYLWDFGDGATSTVLNPTHEYYYPGNYTITFTVEDSKGNSSTDTTWAIIEQSNDPPSAPSITGPDKGKFGETYNYTFSSSDPNGHDISYFVDWGDDTTTGWTEFVPSGTSVTLSHIWERRGTYTIRAQAKDTLDATSGWGELPVRMPYSNTIIKRYLSRFPFYEKPLKLLYQ